MSIYSDFLLNEGDSRIRPETLEFYKFNKPEVFFVARNQGGDIIGLAGSNLDGSRSVVVVHEEYRNNGLGSALLSLLKSAVGAEFKAWIAEDNGPSNRMAEKAGLSVRYSEIKIRSSGEYKALMYV